MMRAAIAYTITAPPTIIMMVNKQALIQFPIVELMITIGNKMGLVIISNQELIPLHD